MQPQSQIPARAIAAFAATLAVVCFTRATAQTTLSLGAVSGAAGQSVTVPMTLVGSSGVCAVSHDVAYDPAFLTLSGVQLSAAGQMGVLAQLEGTGDFRSNVGIVNLGSAGVTVAVRLYDATGTQVGQVRRLTADAGLWVQQDDIFAACGAGSLDLAYARVEVETEGGTAWAYASVIDQATGDPTTIPVLLP